MEGNRCIWGDPGEITVMGFKAHHDSDETVIIKLKHVIVGDVLAHDKISYSKKPTMENTKIN